MRIPALCALLALPGAAVAESGDHLQKGPYLQRPEPGVIEVAWEGRGAREAELELLGEDAIARLEPASSQSARLEGLGPAETYRYEVRVGGAAAGGSFRTAPGGAEPVSFVVMGNTRGDDDVLSLLASRARAENPDFVVTTGNAVSDGLSEHGWQRFFDALAGLLAGAPLFPALGQNDRQGEQRTSDHFDAFFALPGGADAADHRARRYTFDYGQARFIVADSTASDDSLEEEAAWLEDALRAARADESVQRVFAITHHGPLSVGLDGGDDRVRDAWQPLFEDYEVDAVFSGHDHVYSRLEAGGVRYFVTGGGGARLYSRDDDADPASREALERFESAHHYLRVDAFAGFVEVTAVRVDGTVIETTRWGEPRAPGEEVAGAMRDLATPPAREQGTPGASEPPSREDRGRSAALGSVGLALAAAGSGVWLWCRRRERL